MGSKNSMKFSDKTIIGEHEITKGGKKVKFVVHNTITKTIQANKGWYYSVMPILSQLGYHSVQIGQYPRLVKKDIS